MGDGWNGDDDDDGLCGGTADRWRANFADIGNHPWKRSSVLSPVRDGGHIPPRHNYISGTHSPPVQRRGATRQDHVPGLKLGSNASGQIKLMG